MPAELGYVKKISDPKISNIPKYSASPKALLMERKPVCKNESLLGRSRAQAALLKLAVPCQSPGLAPKTPVNCVSRGFSPEFTCGRQIRKASTGDGLTRLETLP